MSNCGVSCADGEGFGLCAFEQMGVGIPQVLSNIIGHTEYCNEKNGILVDPKIRAYIPNCISPIGGEISIVDYVLSGGEFPAMVLIDAVVRQLPGTIGSIDSVKYDSFYNGLLDYPHYTKPKIVENMEVPSVLLNGDHAKISKFRRKQSLGRTWLRRPDLLYNVKLTEIDEKLLKEFISELS